MSSPDRMEQLARAIRTALEAAEESSRRWERYDADMAEFDRRVEEHDRMFEVREATLRGLVDTVGKQEEEFRAYRERMQGHDQRLRELRDEARLHDDRINDSLRLLTQLQAEITRLDAAS